MLCSKHSCESGYAVSELFRRSCLTVHQQNQFNTNIRAVLPSVLYVSITIFEESQVDLRKKDA